LVMECEECYIWRGCKKCTDFLWLLDDAPRGKSC
jgi:hypothetical protein